MTSTPTNHITSPHALVSIKDSKLDQDRVIKLTQTLAERFATQMNQRFSIPQTQLLLSNGRAEIFVHIITSEPLFPFIATLCDGRPMLTPKLDKLSTGAVLKDISDGVTEICKRLAADASINEQAKFAMGLLFQPAIYDVYHAAGMTEGAHSKYTSRSC